MKPEPVTFYVYADSEQDIQDLSRALYDFVDGSYRRGVVVTAAKLASLLRQYGMSPIVMQVLKTKV